HQQQAGDGRDEGQAVEEEGPAGADAGDQHTRDGGADQAGGLEVRRVQADRVLQLAGADELGDEGLAGRVVDDGGQAERERGDVDVPDLDAVGEREDGQHQGGEGHRGLGDEQGGALAQPVDEDASVEAEQQHRQELQGRGDADGGGGAG